MYGKEVVEKRRGPRVLRSKGSKVQGAEFYRESKCTLGKISPKCKPSDITPNIYIVEVKSHIVEVKSQVIFADFLSRESL